MSGGDRRAERLGAYHDGELAARVSRRMAEALERAPEERAELARLAAVGEWVREAEAARPSEMPDLWSTLAPRLAAIDAERAAARAAGGWAWLLRPVLAGAAASAVAAGVLAALFWSTAAHDHDVVQWLDSQGAPVMVLESPDDTTIIWVMDAAGDDVSEGFARVSA